MKQTNIPKDLLGFFKYALAPFRWKLVIFFVTAGFGSICFVAAPFAIRTIINDLSAQRVVTSGIWWLIGLFALLRFLDEWAWRFADWWVSTFLPELRERLRRELFAQTLRKPHRFFVNASSGQLGYWINGATEMVRELLEGTFWSMWPQLVAFAGAAVFLTISSPMLSTIYAGWFIALMVVVGFRGKTQAGMVAAESDATSAATGRVVDVVSNNLPVRVFGARGREIAGLEREQAVIIRRWKRWWWYGIISNAIKGNSAAGVSALAVALVVGLYAQGKIGLGDIALFVTYITSMSERIWELSWQLNNYFRNYGNLKNAVTNLLSEENEREDGQELHAPKLDVHFRHLGFSYPDQEDHDVLREVELSVAAGERVGIVGHSGAGKSTIVGLLLGLYEPTSGALEFNGQDVRELNLDSVRRHIAYVPQDTGLFNRTIAENIGYGQAKKPTKAEIEQAASRAQALEFIQALPQGFDSLVGERGVKLSGGQRQRIAIARAMLSDAPLVVLDEATSALDSANEQLIQKALAEVMKGRTAIVIAHRLSTLSHLERIIVLDRGTVVQSGRHGELLSEKGIYADLWARQKGGFIGD